MTRPSGESKAHEVTQLLQAWGQGQNAALEQMLPIVYHELRRLAHRYMAGERQSHTLQTTALVNEVYLKLIDSHRCAKHLGVRRLDAALESFVTLAPWRLSRSNCRGRFSKAASSRRTPRWLRHSEP